MPCILSETPNETPSETADGTQKENVKNIVVVLLYNNIIFYLLLKYNQSIYSISVLQYNSIKVQ